MVKSSEENFLDSKDLDTNKEARYNIFRFQDHLLSWIYISAQYFQARDYSNSFEALTIVYTDVNGFLEIKEQVELKALFDRTTDEYNSFLKYNNNYEQRRRSGRKIRYEPSNGFYVALLDLRLELMRKLAPKNMLMMFQKRSEAGAGMN